MANTETAAHGAVPQAHSASLVGQILDGRYRILRKLGEGETGEVYAAEHVESWKKFAIKLLRRELFPGPEAVARFFAQTQSAASIAHRNIAELWDAGQLADGRVYLCMDLLAGAALRDLITQPMAVDRLLSILMQAGQGLAAAHARGIVHRDLKPENIFVTFGPDGEDVPKLLDFGIADASSTDPPTRTRAGTISGTPSYWAPEQVLGKPVDARTDIYALGEIMYECFSGTLPFQGDSPIDVLTQRLTKEPEPVAQRAASAERQLPPGLAAIIMLCLRKDPAQRFQSMDELVDALAQIHRGVVGSGGTAHPRAHAEARRAPADPGAGRPRDGEPSDGEAEERALGALPRVLERASSPDVLVDLGVDLPPLALDENVQFTVYRPRAIAPVRWYSLIAFAHLAERRPGELDAPDPIDEVRHQAEAVLGEHAAAYQSTTQDSGAAIPAEGELVFVVEIPGVEVNPPRRSFLWTEPVHREEFRIRAAAQIVGTTARGRLTVFLGCIVIAELPLAVRVDAAPATTAVEHTQVRTYRKIFASYSHRDGAIVHQFERYARALGDEYLRDAVHLRSGEVWSYQLLRLIEQADAFQLFWSHNSMHSRYVRQEYEYALSLNRPSFVRPTYWEEPMPTAEGLPPEALRRLHFQKLGDTLEDPQPKGVESSTKPSMPSDRTGFMMDSPGMLPPIVVSPPREDTGAFGPPGGPPGMPMGGPPGMPMGPPGGPLPTSMTPAAPASPGGYNPASPGQKTIVSGMAPAKMGGQPGPAGQMQPGSPIGLQMPPYGTPAARPNKTVMLAPSDTLAGSVQAVRPPRAWRVYLRRFQSCWSGGRAASLLALAVLALLAVGFLLRWIF
jgi:Protein kinase domain/TIR domain